MMKGIYKYIIVDTGAILFGESTTHSQVAEGFKKVYGAGFCRIDFSIGTPMVMECYDRSDSLNIEACKKDEQIIQYLFVTLDPIKYYAFSVKEYYEGK